MKKKQNNSFPTTTNIAEEILYALRKHPSSSNTISFELSQNFIQNLPSAYMVQTVTPTV